MKNKIHMNIDKEFEELYMYVLTMDYYSWLRSSRFTVKNFISISKENPMIQY